VAALPISAGGKTAEEVARQCANAASGIILERFGGQQPAQTKGRGNFVTETDLATERAVLGILRQEYPGHALLSEEKSASVERWQEGWLWVVDPLDGTHNFSCGIPHFAFNIALCHDGEPVLGLTLAPVTGDEFFATEGGGLFVNGQPARVAATTSLEQSMLGMEMGYDDGRAAQLISLLAKLWPGVQSVRVMGSAALGLAFAACGRFDLYVHHALYPWDIAAGILLVREAGGVAMDRDGGPVTIYSESVIGGAAGPVRDFLTLATGKTPR
jgi:fructose-1,6-bisphosphatase/inositol monophosphatase family enzyme